LFSNLCTDNENEAYSIWSKSHWYLVEYLQTTTGLLFHYRYLKTAMHTQRHTYIHACMNIYIIIKAVKRLLCLIFAFMSYVCFQYYTNEMRVDEKKIRIWKSHVINYYSYSTPLLHFSHQHHKIRHTFNMHCTVLWAILDAVLIISLFNLKLLTFCSRLMSVFSLEISYQNII
jgi:hypothetical protein